MQYYTSFRCTARQSHADGTHAAIALLSPASARCHTVETALPTASPTLTPRPHGAATQSLPSGSHRDALCPRVCVCRLLIPFSRVRLWHLSLPNLLHSAPGRSLHAVEMQGFIFAWPSNRPLDACSTSSSSIDRHPGPLHISTTVNNAAMSRWTLMSLQGSVLGFFSCIPPRSGITGSFSVSG